MSDGPKILVLDIETLPAEVYVFDLWKQNISLAQIKVPVRLAGFGAKWVGEETATFYGLAQLTAEELAQRAFELLDEADIVVTFNGDNFDLPHLQREFLEFGMGRPSPFKSVDLYKVVKRHHRFLSKKLAHILERLQLTLKIENSGWPLWIGCVDGDPIAWAEMAVYCIGDVDSTEELYHELLVWIDNHPNVQLYMGETTGTNCPKCGSDRMQKRGTRKTKVSEFQQYQCQTCGGWCSVGRRLRGVETR